MQWRRLMEGCYAASDGHIGAIVSQEGELWVSQVSVGGRVVDLGEWDGRGAAIRCAEGAVQRALLNRNPLVKRVEADMIDEDPADDEEE